MSRCAAAELSPHKIRVNAICPGLIATSIFGTALGMPREVADQMAAQVAQNAAVAQPIPKAGLPADIAAAALYLACDDSLFVSGTHIVVDGAITVGARHAWDTSAAVALRGDLRHEPGGCAGGGGGAGRGKGGTRGASPVRRRGNH